MYRWSESRLLDMQRRCTTQKTVLNLLRITIIYTYHAVIVIGILKAIAKHFNFLTGIANQVDWNTWCNLINQNKYIATLPNVNGDKCVKCTKHNFAENVWFGFAWNTQYADNIMDSMVNNRYNKNAMNTHKVWLGSFQNLNPTLCDLCFHSFRIKWTNMMDIIITIVDDIASSNTPLLSSNPEDIVS